MPKPTTVENPRDGAIYSVAHHRPSIKGRYAQVWYFNPETGEEERHFVGTVCYRSAPRPIGAGAID